jgi:hypothetical protein
MMTQFPATAKGVLKVRNRTVTVPGPDWSPEQREIQDVWYEVDIDDRWIACFRIASQQGRPIVSELRAFPTANRREPEMEDKPGEWSAEWQGSDAPVPSGGLTATVLRKVPFLSLSAVPEIIDWVRAEHPEDLEWIAPSGLTGEDRSQRRPGPKGPTDAELVEYAVEYFDLVLQGKPNPHTILSRSHRHSPDHSKHLISTARERSLISSPAPPGGRGGRPGGVLLPRGEAVLRGMKKSRGSTT